MPSTIPPARICWRSLGAWLRLARSAGRQATDREAIAPPNRPSSPADAIAAGKGMESPKPDSDALAASLDAGHSDPSALLGKPGRVRCLSGASSASNLLAPDQPRGRSGRVMLGDAEYGLTGEPSERVIRKAGPTQLCHDKPGRFIELITLRGGNRGGLHRVRHTEAQAAPSLL